MFYYLIIRFNILFMFIYLLIFLIGITTGIFIELKVRKIESATKKDAKGL